MAALNVKKQATKKVTKKSKKAKPKSNGAAVFKAMKAYYESDLMIEFVG